MGFPRSSVGKGSACSAGDLGSIPRSGRSPGDGNSNPLKYYCLGNPMDRRAWQVTVHGFTRVGHDLVTKPSPWFEKISNVNKTESQRYNRILPSCTVTFSLFSDERVNQYGKPPWGGFQHTRTFSIQDSWKSWPPSKQISLLFYGISSRVLSSRHVPLVHHHLPLTPTPSPNPHRPPWLSSAH